MKKEKDLTSATSLAFRVGSEFFSGILVGLIFGYAIDYYFETKPWGMVIMILLGFAAGFWNIVKLFSFGQGPTNSLELTQEEKNAEDSDILRNHQDEEK